MAVASKPTHDVKVAAIDLGSNAIRLEIARLGAGRTLEILCDEREAARLGADVFRTGELSEKAKQRALEALARFATLIRRFRPEFTRVVATSAIREASNYDQFVRAAKARTGLEIDVISGGEEARLLCLGAIGPAAAADHESLVLDIGGGSTEIAVARGSDATIAKSLPLGTVRLTEVFLKSDPAKKKQVKLLKEYVREILKSRVERSLVRRFASAIACAGTAGAVATLVRGELPLTGAPPRVAHAEVKELLRELSRKSVKERQAIAGLDPSRADVIVAGVAILEGVMDYLELEELEISRRGVRDGLLIDTLRRAGLWDAQDPDRAMREAVENLGRKCGFDFAHARQVTRLALSLFDSLQPRITAGGPRSVQTQGARRILEVAAMLHDIGTFIAYSRHHKHSAYLIANAEIPGLTETEKGLASNVARYHRRAHPRERHPEFVILPEESRSLVRKLAGILRIADGLDRTHDGRVRGLQVKGGRGRALRVGVESGKDLELELWAVRQKAALFHEAFDMEIHFDAAPDPDSATASRASRSSRRS